MEYGNVNLSAVEQWLTGDKPQEATPATNTTPTLSEEEQFLLQPNKDEPTTQDAPEGSPVADDKEVEKFLTDSKKTGDEAPQEFFKDYSDLYSKLQENQIAHPLEEGYLPKTQEELLDALKQSADYNAKQRWQQVQKERTEALPDSLRRIHEYAEKGVTTAAELSRYMGAMSQLEAIASLDVKSPEDQRTIVMTQLVNQGLSEKDALAEITDLTERNKLESSAQRYFPAIKKAYNDQVKAIEQEKAQVVEQEKLFVDNNGVNAAFFLDEKNQDYIPFKITSNTLKRDIWNLAAGVVGANENNEAVFAWEQHMKSLMMGDEKSYRKFMKVIAFMANDEEYDKNVSQVSASQTNKTNFKKIAVQQPAASSAGQPTEPSKRTIQPTGNSRWTGR